jgi:hypothetical protein
MAKSVIKGLPVPNETEIQEIREALEKAERRVAALKGVAQTSKLRYQRAEAELARLHDTWPRRVYRRGRRAVGRSELHSFCLFIGYPRSGHSLLGSLLDAHPDMAIAHEVNVLALVAEGLDRQTLFHTLLSKAEEDGMRTRGRRASGYSYAVPDGWQGYVRHLRVLGAKAGEKTTLRLGRNPDELAGLRHLVGAPVRLIHVTRNPFDTIARMALITKKGVPERTVAGATDFLARLARVNDRLITRGAEVLTIRHESFISDPRAALMRCAEFLRVAPDAEWLDASASIVFTAPKPSRELIEWTDEERAAVDEIIAQRAFFEGYTWAGTG